MIINVSFNMEKKGFLEPCILLRLSPFAEIQETRKAKKEVEKNEQKYYLKFYSEAVLVWLLIELE